MWILDDQIINFLWITYDSFCYCWSWEEYWKCCMNTIHEPWQTREEIENMNPKNYWWKTPPKLYEKSIFWLCKKCILCDNDAIKSHTISNNWMRKSFNDDFVSTVLPDEDANMVLKKTPINKASRIPIRCSTHDHEIFKPIDNDFDINNNHHLNLLAYRAVWREKQLLLVNNKISYSAMYWYNSLPVQLQHAEYYKRANEMFTMTKYIENWIKSSIRNWLLHKKFCLGRIEPVFLSTAFNSRHYKDWRKEQNIIMLSILTIDNIWYLIVSFKDWEFWSKLIYDKIKKNSKKWTLIPFLNELIWKNCENIVCDKKHDWELIQKKSDWDLYQHWEHNYIIPV